MIVKRLNLSAIDTGALNLGFVGENEHTQYRINCASVFTEYPNAVASMLVKSPSGVVYPKTITTDGTVIVWTVTESDTAEAGNGQIQLTFTESGAIVKTVIAATSVNESLVGDDPPPEPIQTWIEEANTILAKVDGLTATAEALPTGSDPTATVSTVDGHYNIDFGIPGGSGGDPTEIIDDTAGAGDVTKVWSASKTYGEVTELKSAIDSKAPVILQTASGDIVSFADGADGMPLSSCVVSIDPVQPGENDPSPTNVRPLYGWTGATISRASEISAETSTFYNSTITGQGNPQSSTTRIRTGMMHPGKGQFKLSVSGDWYATIRAFSADTISSTYYVSDESVSSWTYANGAEFTLTTAEYCVIVLSRNSGDSTTVYPTDCAKLVISKKADTTVFPVNWQTAAGTVYGGTLDTVTGVLTVDRAKITLDKDGNYGISTGTPTNRIAVTAYQTAGKTNGTFVSDKLKTGANGAGGYYNEEYVIWGSTSAAHMWISVPTTIDTVDKFKTWLTDNPIDVVYELATPTTVQLSAIEVLTLLGQNHIWADTGAVAVTYPADTQTYVDSAIQTATDPDGNVVTVSGSTPSITGESGKRYVCGTVDSISITPPSTGIIDVVFTSGTTPTVLTVPSSVKFPAWFDATSLDASTVYEINIADGVYGAVMAWPI